MKFIFTKCEFKDLKNSYIQLYKSLNSPIDTFHENKILGSNHYKISLNSDYLGYCSIEEGSTITQFNLLDSFKHLSQEVFSAVKKLEYVSQALVPTCDEFYLSHALDNFTKVEKQAYFFKYKNPRCIKCDIDLKYRLANREDIDLINSNCDTDEYFFDDKLEDQINNKEVYIGFDRENVAAFGILERSKIVNNVASIGMYTNKNYRNRGVGKRTLYEMILNCQKEGIDPISGCWYFNHNSKKTLESIGFISGTRYLRVTFN